MKNEDQPIGSRDDLIQISVGFLREVKDMTTGAEMETWLNEKYGEESQLYRDLARLITAGADEDWAENLERSEEHTSELQSLMRISYAVFCLKKKKTHRTRRSK